MPPQHGKSVGATTLLPAYILGLDPDCRVAIASYSGLLASKFNRRVQRILSIRANMAFFPATTIKHGAKPPGYIRTSDEVEIVDRRGGLLSVGREGSLTGNRVDCFHPGRPIQGCPGGQFAPRALELLGVVHLGGPHAHAQHLARADRLHALARGGPHRRNPQARAGRDAADVVAARHHAARPLAASEFRGAEGLPPTEIDPRPRARPFGKRSTAPRCWPQATARSPPAVRGDVPGASLLARKGSSTGSTSRNTIRCRTRSSAGPIIPIRPIRATTISARSAMWSMPTG